MKARGWLLLPCSVLVADAALVAIGCAVARTGAVILAFAALHAVVALAFGAVLGLRGQKDLSLALLGASLALFVPVMGSAALLAAVYVLYVTKPKAEATPYHRYAPPDPIERRPLMDLRPRVLVDRLVFLVRYGRTIDTRFKAVLETKEAPAVVSVPVLKAALADSAEEVRLSAFSQLEKTRRAIDLRIERAQVALKGEAVPSLVAHELHASLAQDHFEIAYLGLAEGEVYKHALNQALSHAREALALSARDPAMLRLVGRIRLRQSQPGDPTDDVREALDAARSGGMPIAELAADYAEEAFRRRAWDEVASVLAELRGVPHDHVILAKVQEFWRWR